MMVANLFHWHNQGRVYAEENAYNNVANFTYRLQHDFYRYLAAGGAIVTNFTDNAATPFTPPVGKDLIYSVEYANTKQRADIESARCFVFLSLDLFSKNLLGPSRQRIHLR